MHVDELPNIDDVGLGAAHEGVEIFVEDFFFRVGESLELDEQVR